MDILNDFEIYLKENYGDDENNNTVLSYKSDIKQFLKFFDKHFGERIINFSRAHVLEYKKFLTEDRELKYSTINRKLASLSVYENFLIESKIRKDDSKVRRKRDFIRRKNRDCNKCTRRMGWNCEFGKIGNS